jgi:Zinc knuckle
VLCTSGDGGNGASRAVSDEALVHRFVEVLPQRLKVQALLISGDYYEVVSKTSLVQKSSQRAVIGPEMIREVNEGCESRPRIPFSERTCFRCNQKGHMARFCPLAGNGGGSSEQSTQTVEHGIQNATTQINQSGAQPAQGTEL